MLAHAHDAEPPHHLSAYKRLSTLGLQTKFQMRTARKTHVDAHYSNSQMQMLRTHAVRAHEDGGLVVVWVSVDDKAKLPLGVPGLPQATIARTRKVVVGTNEICAAMDHDYSPFQFTPSVTLVCEPGKRLDDDEEEEDSTS